MANKGITFHVENDKTLMVLLAEKEQKIKGLNAIGSAAASHAKRNCPVDTGRLRNSISYASQNKQGGQNGDTGEKAKGEDYKMRGTPEDGAVYIGTNVSYAPAVEYIDRAHKTGGAHYIKNAAANHSEEYKKIMEAALKA